MSTSSFMNLGKLTLMLKQKVECVGTAKETEGRNKSVPGCCSSRHETFWKPSVRTAVKAGP